MQDISETLSSGWYYLNLGFTSKDTSLFLSLDCKQPLFSWNINITDYIDLSLNYTTDMYVKRIRICEPKLWLRNSCEEVVVFLGAVYIVVGNVIQNNLKCLSEATDNLHTLFITSEPSCVYIYIYLSGLYTHICLWYVYCGKLRTIH